MDLREFSEFVQSCIDPIITASQTFGEVKEPLILGDKIQYFISVNVITSVSIVNEYCRRFHDSIEFSAHLPLTVVPFLLPLLTLLKKVLAQVAHMRQIITRSKLCEEDYQLMIEELCIIKYICDELVIQVHFTLQRARFQEKTLKQAS